VNWLNDILQNSGDVTVNLLYKDFDLGNNLYALDVKSSTADADEAFNHLYESFRAQNPPDGIKGVRKFLFMLSEAVDELHRKHYL